MHKSISISHDSKRGCGWRKEGGLYLIDKKAGRECGRLPIPTTVCPCCGRGIKPSRGWTWVDADEIMRAAPPCRFEGTSDCEICPLSILIEKGMGRAGLIWIGEKYYPTANHYLREVERMGDSRRIKSVPRGYRVGETYVLLAHRKAILTRDPEMGKEIVYEPGIFRIIQPEKIEVVVTGDESDDVIDGYVKRGLSPVVIERLEDKQEKLEMEVNSA